MVQNLRLVGSRTLTPSDSDVTSNFVLPASSDNFGTTNDAAGVNIPRLKDSGNASYGVYYNWYTATAGSGTYAIASGSVTQSICPKGWKLPTATSGSGETSKIYSTYSNYNTFITVTSAALSGYWAGSSAGEQGSAGNWWSRTAVNATTGYGLYFNKSSIHPRYNNYKRLGFVIRCVSSQ